MGLRINRGPTWDEDAFGYINTDVSEMNIRERRYEQDSVADADFEGGDPDTSYSSVLERNSQVSRSDCLSE